jgi:hypothetical protein
MGFIYWGGTQHAGSSFRVISGWRGQSGQVSVASRTGLMWQVVPGWQVLSHARIFAIKMQKVGFRGKGYFAFPTILIVFFCYRVVNDKVGRCS